MKLVKTCFFFLAEDVEEMVADSGNNLDIDPSPIETGL